MKFHLGCGKRYYTGYINIDAQNPVADFVTKDLISLPAHKDPCTEIIAIHLFEHLWPEDAKTYLQAWFDRLAPGGQLILEMPDIYKTAKNIVADIEAKRPLNPQYTLWPIYGDNPQRSIYDCHKTGWTFRTLAPLLKEVGFSKVEERPPQHHGQRINRDFRIEATK